MGRYPLRALVYFPPSISALGTTCFTSICGLRLVNLWCPLLACHVEMVSDPLAMWQLCLLPVSLPCGSVVCSPCLTSLCNLASTTASLHMAHAFEQLCKTPPYMLPCHPFIHTHCMPPCLPCVLFPEKICA